MGQKVHPTGMRLGIIRESNARWYPSGEKFADVLRSDIEIRQYVRDLLMEAYHNRHNLKGTAHERFLKRYAGTDSELVYKGSTESDS